MKTKSSKTKASKKQTYREEKYEEKYEERRSQKEPSKKKSREEKRFEYEPSKMKTSTPDYYAILDVHRSASNDAIRRAFHTKSLQTHPDRNRSSEATAAFQLINEAYQVLVDDAKRQLHDATAVGSDENSSGPVHKDLDTAYRKTCKAAAETMSREVREDGSKKWGKLRRESKWTEWGERKKDVQARRDKQPYKPNKVKRKCDDMMRKRQYDDMMRTGALAAQAREQQKEKLQIGAGESAGPSDTCLVSLRDDDDDDHDTGKAYKNKDQACKAKQRKKTLKSKLAAKFGQTMYQHAYRAEEKQSGRCIPGSEKYLLVKAEAERNKRIWAVEAELTQQRQLELNAAIARAEKALVWVPYGDNPTGDDNLPDGNDLPGGNDPTTSSSCSTAQSIATVTKPRKRLAERTQHLTVETAENAINLLRDDPNGTFKLQEQKEATHYQKLVEIQRQTEDNARHARWALRYYHKRLRLLAIAERPSS